jgi:glycosyltransferase involved in cell wall biosynthesis
MSSFVPDLSVIICSYDRYGSLDETLDRLLAAGGVDTGLHEILVVENTPTRQRCPIDTRGGTIRVTFCEKRGLSAARNWGISESTGQVVAFLDDDALVSPDWCRHVVQMFQSRHDVQAAGGKVVAKYLGGLPPWFSPSLSDYLSCIDWGDMPRFLNSGEWIVGANMFFRRTIFDMHGRFDTNLGRKGTHSLLSNEESSLLDRIGITNIFYDPALVVEHVISPERISLSWFRRRVYWQAISDMVSGAVYLNGPEIAREYGTVIASIEPEHRNLKCMSFLPRDSDQFALQLRAIYLSAIMLGKGLVDLPA